MVDDTHSTSVTDNLGRGSTWLRLVYMLILAIAWVVTEVVFIAVIVLQFLAKLFTGRPLKYLTAFGSSLADYMAQIVRFETFVTEDLAFPFAAWPSPTNEESAIVSPPPRPEEQSAGADEAKPRTDSDTEGESNKKPRTRRTRKADKPK